MNENDTFTIAIHHRPGSFSDRWIEYCNERKIRYRLVNCYASDIVGELRSCSALLWHWHHTDTAAALFARQLFMSLKNMDIVLFPNINTCWHFDDKLGQKYLLESIGAPLVPSHVFYSKREALNWIASAKFPIVFKLRAGAGSSNVRLVQNRAQAKNLCKTAFGRGFRSHTTYFADFATKVRQVRKNKDYLEKITRFPSRIRQISLLKRKRAREKGYIYFQDFMPGNKYDTRITVIGKRAFGFRRIVREGDFRASGSGVIDYDKKYIDLRSVKIALEATKRIGAQSLAFDFVMDGLSMPRIVEISYGYMASAVAACTGYWDDDLKWHQETIFPEDAVLCDILASLD